MKPRAAIPGQDCPGLKKIWCQKKRFSEPRRPRLRILAISFQHDYFSPWGPLFNMIRNIRAPGSAAKVVDARGSPREGTHF